MSFNIHYTSEFAKELKKLAKKYPSIKTDISILIQSLKENPQQGVALGNNCYKIRMAIHGKQSGKSGGARVITMVIMKTENVLLLSIYDKSIQENISNQDLKEKIKKALGK